MPGFTNSGPPDPLNASWCGVTDMAADAESVDTLLLPSGMDTGGKRKSSSGMPGLTCPEEEALIQQHFLLRGVLVSDPAFIETVPRRGYRFIGAVRCSGPSRHTCIRFPKSSARISSDSTRARRAWRSGITGDAAALLASSVRELVLHTSVGRGGETIDLVASFSRMPARTEYGIFGDGITEVYRLVVSGAPI